MAASPMPAALTTSEESPSDEPFSPQQPDIPTSNVRQIFEEPNSRPPTPENSFPEREPAERAQEGLALLQAIGLGGKPKPAFFASRSHQGDFKLPYPLDNEAFTTKYVRPLFETGGSLRVQEAEILAATVIKQVDIIDSEWCHIADWADRQEKGTIFKPSERVNDVPVEGWDLREGPAPRPAIPLQRNSKKTNAPKRGRVRARRPGPKKLKSTLGSFRMARSVNNVLEMAYSVGVKTTLGKMDDRKNECTHLRYRRALALARADKWLLEETEASNMLATLPACSEKASDHLGITDE
ncbi:hypothetical protein A1O3_00874 [Capronia epimyces CBS 606.96]|uniref:Uncharacterized protein n=1 Tax=Capronia epimyces CBS 606.96 TaxID=1182542 RepID=W9ZCS1_9EURO|nr:uncharacterized protein A1O3_00874 [Capronia epimyces CBS 606.96]EXJ92324.1 hypothetical protein A1O3_00874 [Capronia epimyces CBS 606.96]